MSNSQKKGNEEQDPASAINQGGRGRSTPQAWAGNFQ